jgi:hypothetical protein
MFVASALRMHSIQEWERSGSGINMRAPLPGPSLLPAGSTPQRDTFSIFHIFLIRHSIFRDSYAVVDGLGKLAELSGCLLTPTTTFPFSVPRAETRVREFSFGWIPSILSAESDTSKSSTVFSLSITHLVHSQDFVCCCRCYCCGTADRVYYLLPLAINFIGSHNLDDCTGLLAHPE